MGETEERLAALEARVEALNEFVKNTIVHKIDILSNKVDKQFALLIKLNISFIVATLGLIGTIIVVVVAT